MRPIFFQAKIGKKGKKERTVAMSESMLHDLYFGRISPWERERIHTTEYSELNQQISGLMVHFKELLSHGEYENLEKMQNLRAQAGIIEDVDLFEYSFCLGALMMLDILGFKGNS